MAPSRGAPRDATSGIPARKALRAISAVILPVV